MEEKKLKLHTLLSNCDMLLLMCSCTFIHVHVQTLVFPSLLPLYVQPGEGLYNKLMQHKQSISMHMSLLTSESVVSCNTPHTCTCSRLCNVVHIMYM